MSVTTTKPRRLLCRQWEVRAYLSGAKTQFRRIIRPQPKWVYADIVPVKTDDADPKGAIECPFGTVGSRLWVAEAFAYCVLTSDMTDECHSVSIPKEWYKPPKNGALNSYHIAFKADDDNEPIVGPWRSASVMPQWASRLSLEVKSVRVQRLQDISEEDAIAEGATFHDGHGVGHSGWRHDFSDVFRSAKGSYCFQWESTHGPGSWESNPFVWAVEVVSA